MTDHRGSNQGQPGDPAARAHELLERYWRANMRVMMVLLVVWAAVGLGCGVLLAGWLNQFQIGGFPLGFWFAQQGSIFTFVVLILIYALVLNHLDRKHHEEVEALNRSHPGSGPGSGVGPEGGRG